MDFNVDKGLWFPDQGTDGDPTECSALAVVDIAGNIDGRAYDPDFSFAMTLLLEGVEPTVDGSDPVVAMQSAVAYGLLPADEATFTALSAGELYVADYRNYSAQQKRDALAFAKAGVKNILGNGDDFDSIKTYIQKTGWGASVRVTWFSSFSAAGFGNIQIQNADGTYSTTAGGIKTGVLPAPSGAIFDHEIAIYGIITIGGVEYLIAKPFLGKDFGDQGYCYFSRELVNTVCKSATGFDPDANRWTSLVGIAVSQSRFSFIVPYVSNLLKIKAKPMQTVNGNKLYEAAKASLGKKLTAGNAADDYGILGCAETVNALAVKAWGHPIGGGLSTAAMFECLKDKTRFQFIAPLAALPGDIIISPTGTVPGAKLAHGHVGVVALYGVLSNNSENGTLEENYSVASWMAYYSTYGGLATLCYRPL